MDSMYSLLNLMGMMFPAIYAHNSLLTAVRYCINYFEIASVVYYPTVVPWSQTKGAASSRRFQTRVLIEDH